MIRIQRPAEVPAPLLTDGPAATADHCAAYDASETEYRAGAVTFKFDSKIYAAEEVKKALRRAQHDKCCFCESKVTHISFGDIEHFRPKAAYRQKPEGSLVYPGYYWLAYEWSNLFFCCQLCNQRHKRNEFPLRRPTRRVRSHRDSRPLAEEEPLFLNPEEDPSPYLRFRGEYARAVRRSRRGQATIEALGLNREELVERRRTHLAYVQTLAESTRVLARCLETTSPEAADYRALLDQLAANRAVLTGLSAETAEYTAMVRAALG